MGTTALLHILCTISVSVSQFLHHLSSTSPLCSRWSASVMTECRIWWPMDSSASNPLKRRERGNRSGLNPCVCVDRPWPVGPARYLVCAELLSEAAVWARHIDGQVVLHPLQERHPARTLLLKALLPQRLRLHLTANKATVCTHPRLTSAAMFIQSQTCSLTCRPLRLGQRRRPNGGWGAAGGALQRRQASGCNSAHSAHPGQQTARSAPGGRTGTYVRGITAVWGCVTSQPRTTARPSSPKVFFLQGWSRPR